MGGVDALDPPIGFDQRWHPDDHQRLMGPDFAGMRPAGPPAFAQSGVQPGHRRGRSDDRGDVPAGSDRLDEGVQGLRVFADRHQIGADVTGADEFAVHVIAVDRAAQGFGRQPERGDPRRDEQVAERILAQQREELGEVLIVQDAQRAAQLPVALS